MGTGTVLAGIAVAAAALLLLRSALRGGAKAAPVTIVDPRWAIMDMSLGTAAQDIQSDRSVLEPVLGPPEVGLGPSSVDVLFVYGRVGADGSLGNGGRRLRELIRDSGAKIAVLASSNEPQACMNAAPSVGYGHANLVLTIERKGPVFGRFFAKLFTMMYAGDTMPVAWVKLAPQIPGADHPDAPAAIFGAELGQVTFVTSNKALNPTGLRPAR